MSNDNSVSNKVRQVLIDFKHERYGLGEAMKQMKQLLYKTNSDFEWKGKVKKMVEWRADERCAGCGILLKTLDPQDKMVLDGVIYCVECYRRRV